MLLRQHLRPVPVIGALLIFGLASVPSADAGVTIDFAGVTSATSGPVGNVPPGSASAFITPGSYAVGGTTVKVVGLIAGQLFTPSGTAQSDTVSIQLQNLTSTAVSLVITVTADEFVAPTGLATATNSFGTSNVSSGTSVHFAGDVTNIGTLDTLTLIGDGQDTEAPEPTSKTGSLTNPFTITQVITVNLAGLGIANFTATTEVTAVPEPSSIALAFVALPLLGLVAIRRRRNQD